MQVGEGFGFLLIGGPPGVTGHSRSFTGTNTSFLEAFPQLHLKCLGRTRAKRVISNFFLPTLW